MSAKKLEKLDDEALLELYYSTRNPRVFRLLYARFNDTLYRYTTQVNPRRATAVIHGLWQEVLEGALDLGNRCFRNWLFSAASALLANGKPLNEDQQVASDTGSPDANIPDNALLNAIAGLPRIEKNILLLHTECQLSLAAIADIEKISLRTCRAHLQQAQARLQHWLHGPERQAWRIAEVSE